MFGRPGEVPIVKTIRILTTLSMLAAAWPAAAQSPQAAEVPHSPPAAVRPSLPRLYLGLDGGAQLTTTVASSTVTFKVYGEDARLEADYRTKVALVLGSRAGVRVWRRMVVGVGASFFTSSRDADVTAAIPHPFFFQRPRNVDGAAKAVTRDEAAIYAEIGWQARVSPRIDVTVFAGPAFFRATQEAATRVRYTEQYPYDSATFSDADVVAKDVRATGVTLGADVSYRLSRTIQAGALLRYAYATATVTPVESQPFDVTLGGLQTTIGLRIRF
jgi:hypothetical protein